MGSKQNSHNGISPEQKFLFVGPVVHSIEPTKLCIIRNGLIAVDKGKICDISSAENPSIIAESYGISKENVYFLKEGEFLMPGFVDTHIHAPQYPNIGLGYDKTLLGWLEEYTFPIEEKYADKNFAKHVYDSVVKRTLKNGTTTACYFSTIHVEGSNVLVDAVIENGQRALVGKVNMNSNCPSSYIEYAESSLKGTEEFIKKVLSKKNSLVQPIITPRFAVSCDMELMKKLAEIAKKYDLHIQTHISENKDEIDFVKKLFPNQKSYADVYDSANLLSKKTILAHAVHLSDEEISIIAKRESSISHCPLSNTLLKSGICNVRKLLRNGLKVGLGTDVSGGSSPSILQVMQAALTSSIHLSFLNGETPEANKDFLDYQEVFYLATLGGARALAMDEKIGNFEIGKEFDAILVSMYDPASAVDILMTYDTQELVQKFIFLGDDRNIKRVYVSGKLVKSN